MPKDSQPQQPQQDKDPQQPPQGGRGQAKDPSGGKQQNWEREQGGQPGGQTGGQSGGQSGRSGLGGSREDMSDRSGSERGDL